MCIPPVAIAAAAFVIDTGSKVLEHQAQKRAAEANAEEARKARANEVRDLTLRQLEEGTAASRVRRNVQRDASEAQGLAITAAAEAGVSGGSLQAILGDIEGEQGRAFQDIQDQYTATFDQLERAKAGAAATEASRIAAVPQPSTLATGIRIGGSITNYLSASNQMNRTRTAAEEANNGS